MKQKMMKLWTNGLVLICGALLLLSASIVRAENGSEEQFPEMNAASMKEGTFVSLENLRKVGPNLTKAQMIALLGPPHFDEGVFGVRTWNYIFNFRENSKVVTCQYKVNFDSNYRVVSTHWKSPDCEKYLTPSPSAVVERTVERAVEKQVPVARRLELSADALFAFGKSGPSDISPVGRQELDNLVADLRSAGSIEHVDVIGYADRLGSTAYNQHLSASRASTVRQYIENKGVAVGRIASSGRGVNEPKVRCEQINRAELIACLAPNRRVEIHVTLAGQ